MGRGAVELRISCQSLGAVGAALTQLAVAAVTTADRSMVIQDIPGCSRQVKSTLIQRLFLALDQVGAVISVMVLIQIRINRSAVSQRRSTSGPEPLVFLIQCLSRKWRRTGFIHRSTSQFLIKSTPAWWESSKKVVGRFVHPVTS